MDTGTTNHTEGTLKKRPLPSFVKKLWFILGDVPSHEHIFWVDHGQVICVPNASAFSKIILPRFFKHMYGFRKVYQLNLAYDESAEKRTVWQFKHEFFRKDEPEKLCEIKRRAAKSTQPLNSNTNTLQTTTSHHPQDIEKANEALEDKLERFAKRLEYVDHKRKELWKQTVTLNNIQVRQQKAIRVLMEFMMQFLEKHPDSENDKARFENIVKKIKEQDASTNMNTCTMSSAEEEEEEYDDDDNMITTSSASPAPIHTFPSPALNHHQPQLPSISALIADHSSDILPPLRKRPNNRHN
ncbi:hypothetical protein INT47_005838 [Mucor saturninus]|uniref:HSF-type DNA-binding domain-containing protein n=1 Tax=Mucor saturninus TaxID=64648 RepID=A0A8H7QYK5_9FUNG|nr:hypothetical protein INT47_005838 [Mucor saturninus]